MTQTTERPPTRAVSLRERALQAHQEAEQRRTQERQRIAECAWMRKQDVFIEMLSQKLGITVTRDQLGEIRYRDALRPLVKLEDIWLASMPVAGQSPDLAVVTYCSACNETHWFRIRGLEHLGTLLESERLCWKTGASGERTDG